MDTLLKILKKDAFFKKPITLSSGKKSNFYIDVRRVSLHSKGLSLIADAVWNAVKKDAPTAIGGPTLGADPIVAGVCLRAHAEGKTLKGFLMRKKPKKHGRQNLIEGKELTRKDRVILLDDVATTGSSLFSALCTLRKYKVTVLKTIVVVDREEGAQSRFARENCPFISLYTKSDFVRKHSL